MTYTPSRDQIKELAWQHYETEGDAQDQVTEEHIDELERFFQLPAMQAMFDDAATQVKKPSPRLPQPTQIKAGQLWESRASGGVVVVDSLSRWGRVIWQRVSGRGHRFGDCHPSTLREKYDYVGERG